MLSQQRAKRSASGARYKAARKKRVYEKANAPVLTRVGEKKLRHDDARGHTRKLRLLTGETVVLYDAKSKKHATAKIKAVVENPANRNFVRRNILTKGVIVETDKGQAKLTSRPGQDGMLNGVLL